MEERKGAATQALERGRPVCSIACRRCEEVFRVEALLGDIPRVLRSAGDVGWRADSKGFFYCPMCAQ